MRQYRKIVQLPYLFCLLHLFLLCCLSEHQRLLSFDIPKSPGEMWSTPLVALAAAALFTITLLRDDLRDLVESVRTYAAFYPYLERHPELVYRFPSKPIADARKDGDELVPPILHRIDLSEHQEVSVSEYESAISSCQTLHPNWTHMMWTDESTTEFMSNLYPDLLRRYDGYRQSMEYANILKYALLDHYGGVYLNMDIGCIQPLDALRSLAFLTTAAYPVGVSKAFILSKPHHQFLRRLLEGVERRSFRRRLPGIANILNIGSMYFSNSWLRYVRLVARKGVENVSEDKRVYLLADERGNLDPHVLGTGATSPLFNRKGASSWRDWDNTGMYFVVEYFLLMVGLGAICMTIWLWIMSRRRRGSSTGITLAKELKKLGRIEEGDNLYGMKGG